MTPEPFSHEAVSERFSAYLDRDLPEPELDRVEDHLDDCPLCREEYRTFAEAIALVRDVPRLRAPPSFARRVLRRARRSRTRGLNSIAAELTTYRVHVEVALALLLAAALAVLVIHLL